MPNGSEQVPENSAFRQGSPAAVASATAAAHRRAGGTAPRAPGQPDRVPALRAGAPLYAVIDATLGHRDHAR